LPTNHPPGSPGRIAVYQARASAGLPLFDPRDGSDDDSYALVPVVAANNEIMVRHLGQITRHGLRIVQEAPALSEPPRTERPSVAARKYTASFRQTEAERKRRERARKRRQREQERAALGV